jgi:predicted ATPase
LCWALWHLGYVDQAAAVAAEAKQRAEASSHPFTLAYTICHARGMMDIFRRSPEYVRSYANTVISICTEHGFPFWAAGGQILDGWAIACQGRVDEGIEKLDEGLAAWRKTGARLWLPIFLALKAEAHAKAGRSDTALNTIEEALTISDETGEHWAVAEVLRIKAGVSSIPPIAGWWRQRPVRSASSCCERPVRLRAARNMPPVISTIVMLRLFAWR